jgi:hypothetical protein
MNEETQSKNQRQIKLTEQDYQSLARAMQWPEDLAQWDKDHDTTPTNMAVLLGAWTVL